MSINVIPTTSEETRMVKAIQASSGSVANGIIGNQTLVEIAKKVCPDLFPLTIDMYSAPMIISKNILLFDPNTSLSGYANTLSGSYTYPSGVTPCSIMVNNGKTIYPTSSHSWLGFQDSVIYETFDGKINICRALRDSEIPNRTNVKWAIGGAGLLSNYNPVLEGYSKFTKNGKQYDYSDVWRLTNHTVLGIKDGFKYGVYINNMDGTAINAFCKDKMKFEFALKLDGGHIAAINGTEQFSKINTSQNQGYAIQFIK